MSIKQTILQLDGQVQLFAESVEDSTPFLKLSIDKDHILKIPASMTSLPTLDMLINLIRSGEPMSFSGEVRDEHYRDVLSVSFFRPRPVRREYVGRIEVSDKSFDIRYTERLDENQQGYDPELEVGCP